MSVHKIIIQKGTSRHAIFAIGYDKSGGYFIVDLSSTKKPYYISKIRIRLSGFGRQFVPIDNKQEWITYHKPKLMHHVDGSTHISGTGIRSGFFKTLKKPKGVMTRSPNFSDGGPIFTFLCWGLDKFDTGGQSEVTFMDKHIMSKHPKLAEGKFSGFVFEGYYLPRKAISFLNISDGTILFQHPNFGIIPLKYVPAPSNSPGIVAISCRETFHGFDADHGFSYGGGATVADKNGYNTGIHIVYPFEGKFKDDFSKMSKPKSLHYDMKHRVVYFVDDLISKLISMVTHK